MKLGTHMPDGERRIVHLKHIMRDSCVGKSCCEWY